MLQNMQSGYNGDTMYQAKAIVADKFWIVERNGQKVGTLRRDKDFVLTVNDKKARFPDIQTLAERVGIDFNQKVIKAEQPKEHEVHGFPCKGKPYNDLYDLKRKLPLYTKTERSQSFYCAGYYAIKFEHGWVKAYCPKLITLGRNDYMGPYKTKLEMQETLRRLSNE